VLIIVFSATALLFVLACVNASVRFRAGPVFAGATRTKLLLDIYIGNRYICD
jgi:hypothetical protein